MRSFSRRMLLKTVAGGTAFLGFRGLSQLRGQECQPGDEGQPVDRWSKTPDRVWLGENFWANPMEDWRVVNGAAECQTGGGDRNIQLITHQLTGTEGSFRMWVQFSQAEEGEQDGGAGFRIGSRSDINEYRSNCFAKNGLRAGLVGQELVLGQQSKKLAGPVEKKDLVLLLAGTSRDGQCQLKLTLHRLNANETLGELTATVPAESVLGNVALVNNFPPNLGKQQGSRYRFQNWMVGGDLFTVTPERKFGPILWSMYTLSDTRGKEGFVLKISALTGPLGKTDNHTVDLQVQRDDQWKTIGSAKLDTDAWVATIRVPNWDEKTETPYRLRYTEQHTNDSQTESVWTGIIKENPSERPLRLGALTCQNDYAFPYEPVVENLLKLDPDMLYFSGDQLYENHGGYGLIREPAEPAILNYLRKYYLFGWAFREVLRDRPTVVIPDDHDVFQGNIWGEGGAAMTGLDQGASSKGGYREPARMVNVVHRTCAGHHPDPYDPTPCEQNISVYYGELVYGNVGFAILGDRQWKSGPEHVQTGRGREDHVEDADFDTSTLDKPGLDLLGERQEKFLTAWAKDWRGQGLKVLLSQTVFAGAATHHGAFTGYLKADLDSGGWPQTPRNRAVTILRESKALHINGDQHLTTLVQYGVEKQRDSNWSFCTPAIAVGYPRWWRPDELGMRHERRPQHNLPDTGEYLDGLGNRFYVYAVGNPEVASKKHRYELAHQKGSGFGMVTIDTDEKTYRCECFRFLVDADDGKPDNQFPGWPVTIHQAENAGENRIG